MSDGANMGITAQRALGSILGGEKQPGDGEQATAEQVRERVMAAPDPCRGPGPWVMKKAGEIEDAYSLATDCLAKAFLLAEERRPGILAMRLPYPKDYPVVEFRGKDQPAENAVWNDVNKRWPSLGEWLGEVTSFMVGFAYNTACFVSGRPTAENPAILEIVSQEAQ